MIPREQPMGADVAVGFTRPSGLVYVDHLACIIEAKDRAKVQDITPIAKLRNQLLRRPSTTIGACFSVSGFSEPAKWLTQAMFPQTILLWDAEEIEYCLQKRSFSEGLRIKHRGAVMHGIAHYNVIGKQISQETCP